METVTMLKSVMESTKDVIVIDDDDEEETEDQILAKKKIMNKDKNNSTPNNGVVNIVAVYSLVNTNEIGNQKCDIGKDVPNLINNNNFDEEDTSLPKIVAVTSGIEVIHDDDTQINGTIGNVFVFNENGGAINENKDESVVSKENKLDENEIVINEDKSVVNEEMVIINKNSKVVNTDVNFACEVVNKDTGTDDLCTENINDDKSVDKNMDIVDENNSDYESCTDEGIHINKRKLLPVKMHIKNRIRHIIHNRFQAFRKSDLFKYYPLIKSYIKKLPKNHKNHNLSIKRYISRFNTTLPVRIIDSKKYKQYIKPINKSSENIRTGIREQLKILREKCFKESEKKSVLEVKKNKCINSVHEPDDIKNNINDVETDTDVKKNDNTTTDIIAVACCSKTLTDPLPEVSPENNASKLKQKKIGMKSCDISKYKSLKYKLIANDLDKTQHEKLVEIRPKTPERISSPKQSTSSETAVMIIDLVDNDDEEACIITDDKVTPPDMEDVFQKLRNLRQCIRKIPEEEDILARLKSDRNTNQQEISKEETVREEVYIHKSSIPKTRMKKDAAENAGAGARSGPAKIALPNGKLVKPKTLAEKRRLLRREFESEMRTRMQTNEQLLERQLLRQKSNNRRTESSDIRDRLLQDNVPMTRANWKGLTELLSSEIPYRTQYMMVDGRYVKICGSRGGKRRFISPPPPVHLYRRRKTKKRPIPKKVGNANIPRFLPGPLSKKHLLLRQTLFTGGEYCTKKLPKVMLEIHPSAGRPLSDTCKAFMKLAFSNNIIDKNRANFAASALITSAKRSLLMSETFSFRMPYRNGQECILMRRTDLPKEEIKPAFENELKLEPQVDDQTVVTQVLSDMFSYVETSFIANSVIREDPDAKTAPPSPIIPKETKIITPPEQPAATSTRVKAALELRRLNVTVIEASERSSNAAACCKESYCLLGCVCSSLKCLGAGTKRHCGNVDCMFECRCEFTHRLRQKRSLRQDTSPTEGGMDDDDMLELKDRVCSGLARVEAEFKHAVVVNDDQSVTLVDGDAEKRKRCVKAPKRFDDFVYSDIPSFVPISPVKKIEEVVEPMKKVVKTPIIPKEELLTKKMVIRLHNLAMEDVEPWCMVHELYRCFCECLDAYGQPFGQEKKRKNSDEPPEPNEAPKQSSNSIKTLSRTIMLESGDDDEQFEQKKNWHVELFSTEEADPLLTNKRKKTESPAKAFFYGFPDSTSLRRKSNDPPRRDLSEVFKRKRSSDDVGKEKEKEKPEVGMKRPRLQVKSPWDLNLMADKIKDKTSTNSDEAGNLLREFAKSTKRVINSDVDDEEEEEEEDLPPPELNEEGNISFEKSIRVQRENHKSTMRCARVDDIIKYKVQAMVVRNRKRAAHQRHTTEIAESTNPDLLKQMNILVKRSQVASQQRGLRNGPIVSSRRSTNDTDHNDGQNITTAHNLGPPPLIPAPGVKASPPKDQSSTSIPDVPPKIVNMVSSTLPPREQKTMSNVVNREIMRMLNQKGALDAEFDLSKPWKYRFQCMQWLTMLTKYKNGEIKLWLEKTPEQSSTMALLTTEPYAPVNRCIDMSILNAIAEQNFNRVHVPKFAKKIHSDCKHLDDPKHKAQYVFMRAHQTHWTLEGVIERGQNGRNALPTPQKNQDFVTIRPKSELFSDKKSPENCRTVGSKRPRRSKAPIFTDEKTALLNAELLKARVEIEASIVDNSKKPKEKKQPYNSNIEKDPLALPDDSPIELIPYKRSKRNITRKFEKPVYTKRAYVRKSSVRSESSDSVSCQDDKDSSKSDDSGCKSPNKKLSKSKNSLAANLESSDVPKTNNEIDQNTKSQKIHTKENLDILTSKRPFTIEKIDNNPTAQITNKVLPALPDLTPIAPPRNDSNGINNAAKDTQDKQSIVSLIKSKKPVANKEKPETTKPQAQPRSQVTNQVVSTSTTLEALPFIAGTRYLFVSMHETFSLLTSTRNGYRVTYLQLASAIQTSIYRNVYVRLKFKHNDLNNDAHGIVFAVPWCKEGVFIGPYGLTEQCMISKQIYHRGKLVALSEYSRSIEKRNPKPVGYWMCYNGDDKKFVRAYKALVTRLYGPDKKSVPVAPNEEQEKSENKKVLVKLKGASPNSVLKANLDRIRAHMNGATPEERTKEMPVMTPAPLAKVSLSPYTSTKSPSATSAPTLTVMPKLVVIRPGLNGSVMKPIQDNLPPKDVATIKLLKSTNSSKVPTDGEKEKSSKNTSQTRRANTIRLSQSRTKSPQDAPDNSKPTENSSSRLSTASRTSTCTDGDNLSFVSLTPIISDVLGNYTPGMHDISIGSISSTSSINNTPNNAATSNETPAMANKGSSGSQNLQNSDKDSDDEPDLIIQEPEIEVIDLSSDSDESEVVRLGPPGKRWLYCDVEGIGYVEVEVTDNKKLSIRLPMVSTHAEFEDFGKASIWMNSILKKIVYFLPNSFLPTWKLATSFATVKHIPKMNQDIFQGNYVIYKNALIDLSDQKNIDRRIINPNDYMLATKYAEHYISRYIKHALGLKFASRLTQEQLSDAANTEIKSIHEVEAKLVDQKKSLLQKRTELVDKFKTLKNPEKAAVLKVGKKSLLKNMKNSPTPLKSEKPTKNASNELIVIDD